MSTYTNAAYENLPRAQVDVCEIGALLDATLGDEPLIDLSEVETWSRLTPLATVPDGGPLLLLWCGHRVPSPVGGGLRLIARDSGTRMTAGLGVDDVVAACAESGASS